MHNILLTPNFPHISLHGLHLIKPHQTPPYTYTAFISLSLLINSVLTTSCRTKWSSHPSHTTIVVPGLIYFLIMGNKVCSSVLSTAIRKHFLLSFDSAEYPLPFNVMSSMILAFSKFTLINFNNLSFSAYALAVNH